MAHIHQHAALLVRPVEVVVDVEAAVVGVLVLVLLILRLVRDDPALVRVGTGKDDQLAFIRWNTYYCRTVTTEQGCGSGLI
jgi:hypothetical protein